MKEKLTIVKVGGAVVEDEAQLLQLLKDFSAIVGKKVLVHGGGRKATKVAEALGIESKMVGGRRITDADMLSVVTMVYGGLVNKSLVARNPLAQASRQRWCRFRLRRRCRQSQRPDAQQTHRGRHYPCDGASDA